MCFRVQRNVYWFLFFSEHWKSSTDCAAEDIKCVERSGSVGGSPLLSYYIFCAIGYLSPLCLFSVLISYRPMSYRSLSHNKHHWKVPCSRVGSCWVVSACFWSHCPSSPQSPLSSSRNRGTRLGKVGHFMFSFHCHFTFTNITFDISGKISARAPWKILMYFQIATMFIIFIALFCRVLHGRVLLSRLQYRGRNRTSFGAESDTG